MKAPIIPENVAQALADMLAGGIANGNMPTAASPPWRSILVETAAVAPDGLKVRTVLDAALAREGYSLRESGDINRDIGALLPGAHREDWFAPQPIGSLMRSTFAPVRYAIPDVIQEGLTLFAAPPKLGKTYLMLHLSLAIAHGGRAFGQIAVGKGEVLFLSLEDGPRRVQRRALKLIGDTQPPDGLHLVYQSRTLEDGLLDRLEQWMEAHPHTALIVIDTFARIRSRQHRDDSVYLQDYDALQPLQEFAKRHAGLAVVVIHHTRKMGAVDILETVSGSNGLTGVADAVLVLQRGRGEHEAVLHIIGKDMDEESSKAFKYDPTLGTYTLLGDAAEVLRTKERRQVIQVIRSAGQRQTPKQIADALGLTSGTIRKRLFDMKESGDLDWVDGKYGVVSKPPIFGNAPNSGNESNDGDEF